MTSGSTSPEALAADGMFRAIAAAADQVGFGIVVVYTDKRDPEFAYVNDGFIALTGRSEEELRPQPPWTFIAPEALPALLEVHARYMRGERTPVGETTIVHRDGRRIPIEFSSTTIRLDGRAATVVFAFDVSARKRAEAALRESEARFRSFVENAPDGVLILHWPIIRFANKKAAHMMGTRHPETLIGRNIAETMQPTELAAAERRVVELLRERKPLAAREYTGSDPDGRPLTVEISSIAVEYDGAPAILAFARDVTERRAFLSKLIEADKHSAIGTLAAGVAHEINNPLAYLLLNLEYVLRELRSLPDTAHAALLRQRLEDAKQGAERVKAIVRDLQALTRKDEDLRGPVDLASVLDAALHMARHELRARAEVARKIDEVPPVRGNATRFEQLFLNLLLNAAHAMEHGTPERDRVEVCLRKGADDTVIAEIRDTGVGMPPEVRERAFEPFFTTKPMGVGTGLGLPICQGIVQAVGGEITIESAPGEGTTVRVVFRAQATDAPAPPPNAREVGSEPPPRTRGRVLIIDDEPSVALSLSHELGRRHEVQVARNASEAWVAVTSGARFDAVLCDLVMPGETGMALFERIRHTHPQLADRFVFMTGGAFLPDAAAFLTRTGRPYLEKPFDLTALRRVVDALATAK